MVVDGALVEVVVGTVVVVVDEIDCLEVVDFVGVIEVVSPLVVDVVSDFSVDRDAVVDRSWVNSSVFAGVVVVSVSFVVVLAASIVVVVVVPVVVSICPGGGDVVVVSILVGFELVVEG